MTDTMKRDLRPGDNPADALVWIEALEGEYAERKGREYLCDADGGLCCLGVLCELNGDLGGRLDEDVYAQWPLDALCLYRDGKRRYAGLTEAQMLSLADVNDQADTFAPVIAKIRELLVPADYTPEATQ